MTLTNVQLDDDLAEAFAPALVFGTPEVETSDFSLNTDYDGISLIDLFTGNDSLAVGTAGSLNLTARVDITTGGPAQGNTAYGQSDQLQTRIPSNDPNVTPGTPGDVNPAPLLLADTDGDGVPDSFESASADRDGDGITVTGPNGTNNAVGTANDIVIIQDGSNGFFQFYVTQPGLYTLTPAYPDSGEASTTRLPSADPLDVSTRTDNPAILGGSEVGNTGVIGDFSEDMNAPFYFAFDIEAGDPSIFMNNIPLQSCGLPDIDLTKTVMSEPVRTDDGRQIVTYDFTVLNTGEVPVSQVALSDDLDREAIALSTGFADERFKAGLAAEYRQDENVDTNDTRNTWLLRFTSQYQASEELRLHGKFNRAVSNQTEAGDFGPIDFNDAEFTEGSIAAAYRPIWDDRFNLLAKYTFLEDLSPTSQRFGGETLSYRQRSEIISVDTAFDITPKWTLGGKYAHRSGSVTSNRESLDFTKSSANLGVLRLDYHVSHQWDAHIEGRYLDIGNGVITRTGGQAGVYRHINDNAKLGVGVTWGGIEEEYLGAFEDEDDIGWYLNLVGKF